MSSRPTSDLAALWAQLEAAKLELEAQARLEVHPGYAAAYKGLATLVGKLQQRVMALRAVVEPLPPLLEE